MIHTIIIAFTLAHLSSSIVSVIYQLKSWWIINLLNCKSCHAFWIGLIISGSLFTASLCWLVMMIYEQYLQNNITQL